MEFQFAKYTEITDYAFKVNPDYKEQGYLRFFICPDVNDFWFVRVLEGFNEDYEKEEGSYLVERNKIQMDKKGEKLSILKLKQLILEDDGGNWDYQQGYDMEEMITEFVDGGFGIINRKEVTTINE